MNPSPYGQQYPPQGWPQPQQQQQPPIGGPPVMPLQSQPMLNGNYQQQLTNSMSGMSVNPIKSYPSAGGNMPPPPMGNGPNVNEIPLGGNNNMTPNNNLIGSMGYPNGTMPPTSAPQNPGAPPMPQTSVPPPTSMLPPAMAQQQANHPPLQQQGILPPMQQPQGTPQHPSLMKPAPPMDLSKPIENSFPPTNHSTSSGPLQMTVNSANIPGMPHMPPKAASPFMPPQASGEPPKPQEVQQKPPMTSQFPPQPHLQQKYPPMPPSAQTGPMYPPHTNQTMQQQQQQPTQQQPQFGPPKAGQQLPPKPGQMQMTSQTGTLPQQPGQMPMPPQPGQMPMFPQSGQIQMPPQPGALPPQPGQMQMPPQPGALPPQPGQMQMFAQPGQIQMPPPQPGQMPPQPGQMPFQQGGGPMQYQPGPMPPQPSQYPSQPGQMPMQPGQQMPGRGFNQQPGMYNQQYPQQQQQQQRRLDPDQMPNPIQVMIENQRNSGGTFVTNQPGLLPPLVTTKFVVQDQGNSSPRFVRSSLYCVPSTSDLLKTTGLAFSLIVSPFAKTVEGEYDAPVIDLAEMGPVRCNRCKAYMSPYMQFIDAGRRFHCLMCKVSTEVPTEYFQHLDHTGQRVDKYERPELVLGTYEFMATKDYCRNNTPPEIPAFIFVIDVSYNNIKSGLVHLLCQEIKTILKHFPIDHGQEKSKMRVGFITYNSTVHFYNIKSNLAQPQMLVVGDINDMFMPLLDGFLVDPEESEAVIDALMEQIPKMFVDTKETETILLPAIQAGLEALKASNCAGKLLVFNSSLPIYEAPGKLRNRDDRKLLGTEKEKTILTPQTVAYNTLGQECVQAGCSVDLFLFNNSYIDIATIGQVPRLTGGEVYKYTYFQADLDGKRLIEDIIKNVSRQIAFDSVMRVRTSAGIRATDFYGHFFMSNTTDVELASIDSSKAIAIEIKHDDKLPAEENVYIQIATLYTSCGGQRRLRVLNLALRVTTTIADVFKSCDLDAIILFFAKQSMFKLMDLAPKVVKDNLIHRSAQILACYRKHCTSPTSAGQLILPECLKLLPLYVSCLIKNDAISGGSDMTTDDRSYVIQFVLSMDLQMSVTFFYPRFIPIHNVEPDDNDLPLPMRVTHEKMSEDGAYILENGVYLFLWLGQSLPQSFIQPLFNVQCTQQVNAERFAIVGDTPLAKRVQQIIDTIMHERSRYMRVTCVRQNDKLESVFRHFLIEDRGTDGSASYVDFLCHMHKEIKDLLS